MLLNFFKKKPFIKGYFCLFKFGFLLFIDLLRILWSFNTNKIILNLKSCQHMGGTHPLRSASAVPPCGDTCSSIISLEVPPHSTHVNGGGGLSGLFFSCFFSPPKLCKLVFLVVDISFLIFFLLIFNFGSWTFCKSFISLQFSLSIPIYIYLDLVLIFFISYFLH
jgi:hypothetical protein